MRRFPLEKRFKQELIDANIPVEKFLMDAQLNEHLLDEINPFVTAEEYFRFMETLSNYIPSDENFCRS